MSALGQKRTLRRLMKIRGALEVRERTAPRS
jgi:hypothetical protein